MNRPAFTSCSAVVLGLILCLTGDSKAATATGGRVILDSNSYCRWHIFLAKPDVQTAKGSQQQEPLKGKEVCPPYRSVDRLASPQAAQGWEQANFDDTSWQRSKAKDLKLLAFRRYSTHSLRIRYRIFVTDPSSAGDLSLNIEYKGGVVIYLNGKELARNHLPKGKLSLETLAEIYPDDVFLDSEGKVIPNNYSIGRKPVKIKSQLQARVARRLRRIEPVKISGSRLRKGVNVIAVELRRAKYPAVMKKWFKRKAGGGYPVWALIGTSGPVLCASGSGVTPNASRQKGFQVWTEDRNVRVAVGDYGATSSDLLPLKIVGARNGTFNAQFAVGSDAAISGLKVTGPVLTGLKTKKVIPAKNIKLMGARANVAYYGQVPWFDALLPDIPAEIEMNKKYGGAVMPITVQVVIPRDLPADIYSGSINVSAGGSKAVKVPIKVEIFDWVIPDPARYRLYAGMYQSPTSLALQYKVPMWSEKHWQLIEKSFKLLARIGNRMINVPVVDRTQFGNEDGFITWIKKADGSYDHDLTVFDRYLDMAVKHWGGLDYTALQIWHAAGWTARKPDQKNSVSVKDAVTGKISHMQVPAFDSPEARKFWKPLFEKIKKSLARHKLEKTLILGILSDSTAPDSVFKMFDEVLPPAAYWHRGCHVANGTSSGKPYRAGRGGGVVRLHEHCYGLRIADPDKPLPPFWNLRGQPGTSYDRISNHERYMSLNWYRNSASSSLFFGKQGMGRLCLDFWPVLKGKRGRSVWIYNRYPESSCNQRRPSLQKIVWPGPEGAATTIRFEAFVEGIQDAEAVIAVSEGLSKHGDKLGDELKADCQKVLVDLIRFQTFSRDRAPTRPVHFGWQDYSRRLYECASRIKAKLK
jgi:Glycoside hydrolase 123, catalytic domain